jgi:protein-S-isoprenylcysteine O-methyltransferase Ste14
MRALRLPDLGPRGEGWFVLQLVLFAAIAAAGGIGPDWGGGLRVGSLLAGAALIAAGGYLSLRGVLDLRENLTPFPRPLAGARLIDSGSYGLVRHPIYGGLIIAAAGWGMATASPAAILGAGLLFVFFDLKSRREEAWLAETFEGYEDYRRRTRKMLPGLY